MSKPARRDLSHSRKFFGNGFVYAVISQRAHGLSIGVNMNPDKFCNFDCAYCEVDRTQPGGASVVNIEVMATELRNMLTLVRDGRVRELPGYQAVPKELLELKEVALSGDGEPSLCPNFREVVQEVVHIRAQAIVPCFKIVLLTNATGLHLPEVQEGLKLLTSRDEIWAKLDVGTQASLDKVNSPKALSCPNVGLELVLENILRLGRQRSIVIQSLFPLINGAPPAAEEIEHYIERLRELKEAGAQISLVQVYSAHRPVIHANVGHLPLRTLFQIAQRVRQMTGLKVEVF
jgi:wyosine [tRNA(Phe)-imidazoG37] synthetase (radical SAM superfamily)